MLAILLKRKEDVIRWECISREVVTQEELQAGRYRGLWCWKVLVSPPVIIHAKHILECLLCGRLWGYSCGHKLDPDGDLKRQ